MQQNVVIPKYPPIFVARFANYIRISLVRLSRKFAPANVVLYDILQQFWLSKAIGVTAELGIADILKESPLTAEELAVKTSTHAGALQRMMRVLASNDIFKERKDGRFVMTPLAEALCEGENTMKHMIIHHQNPAHWAMFGEMMEIIKTGESVSDKVLGMEAFEFLATHPERNATFNRAMSDSSKLLAAAVLSVYNFSRFKQIIDIGGGQGYLLGSVLYKNKDLHGILFDQPHVVNLAKDTFDYFGVNERVEILAGSFFESIPDTADAYIMKSIIHDWSDDDSIRILSNIHRFMPNNARLLLIESIIEKGNDPSFAKMLDLLMLVVKKGGKERTIGEFEDVLSRSGFRMNKVFKTVSPFCIIEAVKK